MITITKKEVIRYLGYGKSIPDPVTMDLIDTCIREVEHVAEPLCVWRRYPLQIKEQGRIEAGGITFESRALAKNLKGCGEVLLFAATLGSSVDRLLHRYLKLQISKAAIVQAAGAAAIEDFCNTWQKNMAVELEKEQLYLRPRFSPGYGDLDLSCQSDFLSVLEAGKKVGICLSEGGIMLPEKSVTAIVGISTQNDRCILEGCEVCGNRGCAFRRDTTESGTTAINRKE